ncbi:MAG: hypothetical protein EOO38_11025 [Cytophagaceae bacterium]|nr:MAG: hypothetical protein EOO38_11025 [Cytophagaceae bacterium]
MRVIFWSHWHSNSNGTDYYEALGHYDSLAEAEQDAYTAACDRYEYPSEEDQEEWGVEDEGPDVVVYDYDEKPDYYDGHRCGGGSFEDDF